MMNPNAYLCPKCNHRWFVRFFGKSYKCPKCKTKVAGEYDRAYYIDENGEDIQIRGFYIIEDEIDWDKVEFKKSIGTRYNKNGK